MVSLLEVFGTGTTVPSADKESFVDGDEVMV